MTWVITFNRIFTKYLIIMSLLAYPLSVQANHQVEAENHSHPELVTDLEKPFSPSPDIMREIDRTLDHARAENKLALLIMGANWCHDSRGLAQHFTDDEVASLVTKNYQTLFVDVGFLEFGKEVITRFGMPVIYGTPTVLIIDPTTEKVVNRNNMHQWRDAASIPLSEVKNYFNSMTNDAHWSKEIDRSSDPKLAAAMSDIDAFELNQSERIYNAFTIIGPMLALPSTDRPDTFIQYWNQLRDLRYAITEDLDQLRKNAIDQAKNGAREITLDFPTYPDFEWE